MQTQTVKIEAPELSLIEESKAAKIKATFEPMVIMLEGFEESYNEVIKEAKESITMDVTAKAKRLRLDIGKVRIQTAKLKDSEKEEYKRASNAIQGVHNVIVWAVADKETKLKEIENHFEAVEKERLDALQLSRASLLSEYVDDADLRNLSGMETDVWDAYLAAKKQAHVDQVAAEAKVEIDRLAAIEADRLERVRISEENERLRTEAIETARLAKIESNKREKENKAREAKEQSERKERLEKERKDTEARELVAKTEREERARLANIEREKREKLEYEIEVANNAQREAVAKEEASIQSELSKGDGDKVTDLINDLIALKVKYSFKSVKNKSMYNAVGLLLDKVVNHIN